MSPCLDIEYKYLPWQYQVMCRLIFFPVAVLSLIVIFKPLSSLFNFSISFVYPFLRLKSINIFSLAAVKFSVRVGNS